MNFDSTVMIQRIVQRALLGSGVGEQNGAELLDTEELLVGLLGDQLSQVLEPIRAKKSPEDQAVNDFENDNSEYAELLERNSDLAAALGACDCWGEYADCKICGGQGGPGWLDPDTPLFKKYVEPVLIIYSPRIPKIRRRRKVT